MKEKKVASLKIVFEDGSDYSVACEKGLDKDELANYIERAFKPEPAEPLIKDKKIRKAVRAWWESIPLEAADKLVLYKKNQDLAVGVYTIYCGAIYPDDTLKTGKYYTIAELCGEEEE